MNLAGETRTILGTGCSTGRKLYALLQEKWCQVLFFLSDKLNLQNNCWCTDFKVNIAAV